MTSSPQLHAVLPATGRSRRMGQSKLLMEIGGETVIARLVSELNHPRILSVSVSVRSDDQQLQAEVERTGARVVIPDEPPQEMKSSVLCVLRSLEPKVDPDCPTGWLLIPSDHPVIDAGTLQRVINTWYRNRNSIVIPTYHGRRGHPTIFPWSLVARIDEIPEDRGLNWFLQANRFPVKEVECPHPSVLWDIDTPEDFQRISKFIQD